MHSGTSETRVWRERCYVAIAAILMRKMPVIVFIADSG
jgi:hypothetical protein